MLSQWGTLQLQRQLTKRYNPNPNPTTKQHAVVSIKLNIVACPTYPRENFARQCYCTVFATFRCHCPIPSLMTSLHLTADFLTQWQVSAGSMCYRNWSVTKQNGCWRKKSEGRLQACWIRWRRHGWGCTRRGVQLGDFARRLHRVQSGRNVSRVCRSPVSGVCRTHEQFETRNRLDRVAQHLCRRIRR